MREFVSELENIYDMNIFNDMNCIHYSKLNHISGCYLLHDILNP